MTSYSQWTLRGGHVYTTLGLYIECFCILAVTPFHGYIMSDSSWFSGLHEDSLTVNNTEEQCLSTSGPQHHLGSPEIQMGSPKMSSN